MGGGVPLSNKAEKLVTSEKTGKKCSKGKKCRIFIIWGVEREKELGSAFHMPLF